ncbi:MULTISPECIES: DNA polymerase III subunit chi [Novosphingobium]|uniref:DNA polymerase III subunit chi n=1 Tax=Novosphingobium decolorationis TaxID=2698673 RepID=A0ABX8EC03_9SPHN|nr:MULTISPECIES: DNA polymerase III subunit chi [Novosphingobium]QVM85691.1 DNA polymerase III subunit chi [Novosphingobium decolorationis]GAM07353.1 DNA polymerase III subunit chi [Novosphingobium sp. MBES04]
MRVMFYQLSRDPAHAVVPLLAKKSLEAGARVLVVSGEERQRAEISRGLWTLSPQSFLANGEASDPHAERQPILLSGEVAPANGARFLFLADGHWREGEGEAPFERVFYLFDNDTLQEARQVWKDLRGRDGVTKEYWAQEDGRWAKKASE